MIIRYIRGFFQCRQCNTSLASERPDVFSRATLRRQLFGQENAVGIDGEGFAGTAKATPKVADDSGPMACPGWSTPAPR